MRCERGRHAETAVAKRAGVRQAHRTQVAALQSRKRQRFLDKLGMTSGEVRCFYMMHVRRTDGSAARLRHKQVHGASRPTRLYRGIGPGAANIKTAKRSQFAGMCYVLDGIDGQYVRWQSAPVCHLASFCRDGFVLGCSLPDHGAVEGLFEAAFQSNTAHKAVATAIRSTRRADGRAIAFRS